MFGIVFMSRATGGGLLGVVALPASSEYAGGARALRVLLTRAA